MSDALRWRTVARPAVCDARRGADGVDGGIRGPLL